MATTMMAATLAEGSRFTLTSHLQKNKSMIFVKLTDSAVKAVEDYVGAIVKGDIDQAHRALLELYPNAKGLLTIPGSSPGESHDYNLSIKDIQNDGGLLECLHQRDDRAIESLGKVRLRMQIHANDDIYQATKHKMALAQEESKKNNTVILGDDQATGTIIKRKVKRPFANKFGPSNPASTGNYRSKLTNVPKLTPAASELNKKSVREHLIQLLAGKPSKIGELLARVQERRDTAVAKNMVVGILNEVALFKDGMYQLTDQAWDEVQSDGAQPGKEDRDPARRRPAAHTGPPSSSSSVSISPGSDHNPSPPLAATNLNSPASTSNSPSVGSGRASSSPFASRAGVFGKRAREPGPNNSAHKKLKGENSSGMVHRAGVGRPAGAKPNGTGRQLDHDAFQPKNVPGPVNVHGLGSGTGSINSSPNSSPDSGISTQTTGPPFPTLHPSDSSFDDYLSKFPRIQNDEQLLRYKRDFDQEYPNYKKLYDYVENICRQFTELRESILGKEEESEEWNELVKQTIEKYDEIKTRSTYSSSSKRLCQLHAKLTHIKNMINDYLHHHGNKC